jgi:hypothetical protein
LVDRATSLASARAGTSQARYAAYPIIARVSTAIAEYTARLAYCASVSFMC